MRLNIIDKSGSVFTPIILSTSSPIDTENRRFCFERNGIELFEDNFFVLEVKTSTGYALTLSEDT